MVKTIDILTKIAKLNPNRITRLNMKKTLAVINEMVKQGIIKNYAIGGAIGAMFYTESFNTKDLDVFVHPQILASGLVHIGDIHNYLKKKGYSMWQQYFMIEGVPVDFVAVYDKLTDTNLSIKVTHSNCGFALKNAIK